MTQPPYKWFDRTGKVGGWHPSAADWADYARGLLELIKIDPSDSSAWGHVQRLEDLGYPRRTVELAKVFYHKRF
jgi:hypothetical protein